MSERQSAENDAGCPTCGPTKGEQHPRLPVIRCANCKEWLRHADFAPRCGIPYWHGPHTFDNGLVGEDCPGSAIPPASPVRHVGNKTNAEDCPACEAEQRDLVYPWLCPAEPGARVIPPVKGDPR